MAILKRRHWNINHVCMYVCSIIHFVPERSPLPSAGWARFSIVIRGNSWRLLLLAPCAIFSVYRSIRWCWLVQFEWLIKELWLPPIKSSLTRLVNHKCDNSFDNCGNQWWKWTQKLLLKRFYLARKCSFAIDCRPGSSDLWHEVAISGISKIILRWRIRTLTTVWKQTESVPWCRRHITHQKRKPPYKPIGSVI